MRAQFNFDDAELMHIHADIMMGTTHSSFQARMREAEAKILLREFLGPKMHLVHATLNRTARAASGSAVPL